MLIKHEFARQGMLSGGCAQIAGIYAEPGVSFGNAASL
jgi:hypothetical protein